MLTLVSVAGKKLPKVDEAAVGGGGASLLLRKAEASSGTASVSPKDSIVAVSSEGAAGAGGTLKSDDAAVIGVLLRGPPACKTNSVLSDAFLLRHKTVFDSTESGKSKAAEMHM